MPRTCCYLLFVATALAACGSDADRSRIVGELESERIEITADFAEPIVEILVAEGTSITRGELLLRQDSARARARLVEAEAALAEAQARLDRQSVAHSSPHIPELLLSDFKHHFFFVLFECRSFQPIRTIARLRDIR